MLEDNILVQLQEKWQIFWMALVGSLATLGLGWHFGFFGPFSKRDASFVTGKDLLRGFGYYLVTQLLIVPLLFGLLFQLFGWEDPFAPKAVGWIYFLMSVGGFFAALLAYVELKPNQRNQLWGKHGLSNFGFGVASWFIFILPVLALSQLFSIMAWHLFQHIPVEQIVVQNMRDILKTPTLFVVNALAIVTLVPLVEEFLFRGLLQTWLKQKLKHTGWAIALASMIFSLFHFSASQGLTNVELLFSLFFLSCILGYIYERQHALWAPIGLHSFFNMMSLLAIVQNQEGIS